MKKKQEAAKPQEMIYVVMERGSEYNDEYTEIHESGSAVNAFASRENAEKEAKRRMIQLFNGKPRNSWDSGLFDLGSYESGLLEAIKRHRDKVEWLDIDDDSSYECSIPRGLTDKQYGQLYDIFPEEYLLFYVEEVTLG